MQETFSLLNAGSLLPHGFCIRWTPNLLWLYVVSDALIALAYYSIPITLAYFVWHRKDLKFRWVFLLFGAFILACGTTHILGIITLWKPIYWLDASMKAITAAISIITAIALIYKIPQALQLPSPMQLEQEIQARRDAYEELNASKSLLLDTVQSLEVSANERMFELEQRESYQRTLLDAIPDALFELGLDGRCYSVHAPQHNALNVSPEMLLGKTIQEVLCANAADIVLSALHEAHQTGHSQGKQIEIQLAQETVWFELSVAKKSALNAQEPRFIVLSRNITDRKLAEIDLRIAATAFESQEGILVSNADNVILRVNRAFCLITGYSAEEAVGNNPSFLSSGHHHADFYAAMWKRIHSEGKWEGEIWDKRKNGELYPQHLIVTAVTDHHGQVSNYVATMKDMTEDKRNEQQRLVDEAELRNALVREVHHRIKNNLQGVTGVLSQFVENHPEVADSLNQVISQVQSISLIHGLQGNSDKESVPLHELVVSITAAVGALWKTLITVEFDDNCKSAYILENEAVPLALVLNELITNAVKHGKQSTYVSISADREILGTAIQFHIVNSGQIPPDFGLDNDEHLGTGLQLVARLLPRSGAILNWAQYGDTVTTTLTLQPPIIQRNADEPHAQHTSQ